MPTSRPGVVCRAIWETGEAVDTPAVRRMMGWKNDELTADVLGYGSRE